MSPARILGLFLIVIGVALLGATLTALGGELVVAFLGIAFLVAYVSTRTYGFLIPGAILTGLGIGIVVESAGAPGEVVVLGLGLGFLAIPVIDLLASPARTAWWWPLIPGGILTLVGTADLTGLEDAGRYVVPVVLIAIGLLLLLLRRPGGEIRSPTPTPGSTAADGTQTDRDLRPDAPVDDRGTEPTADDPSPTEADRAATEPENVAG